jgi:hypothetical protein
MGGHKATTKFTGKVIAHCGLPIRDRDGKVIARADLDGKVIMDVVREGGDGRFGSK